MLKRLLNRQLTSPLKPSHVSSLSIILLTHATPPHIAAFAHCCKHIPQFTQIPVYATLPVINLGRTLLQDIYTSTPLASAVIPRNTLARTSVPSSTSEAEDGLQILLQSPTIAEIGSYFALINPLKYSQPHQPLPSPFSAPLNGLTITAYNAGHTLGGTIWHIQQGIESVVYAVDWNQVRENIIGGAAWLDTSTGGAEVIEQLRKPTALICSTKGCEKPLMTGGRLKRDEQLVDMVYSSISKGGTVLIPSDSSARILELAYLLENIWVKNNADKKNNPFKSAHLFLASRTAGSTMRQTASMLEWMDENVIRAFEAQQAHDDAQQNQRNNTRQNRRDLDGPNKDTRAGAQESPFDFKYLKLLERRTQIKKVLSRKSAKVIIASDTSMEWGFSRAVLREIASDPTNLIILTQDYSRDTMSDDSPVSSFGRDLWSWYQDRADGIAVEAGINGQSLEQVYTGGRSLTFKEPSTQPLEGSELLIYQNYLATQRQLQGSLLSNGMNQAPDTIDDASSTSSSSSEDSSPEKQGRALNTSSTLAHANRNKLGSAKEILGVNALLQKKGPHDYDVRGKKGKETMFPYVAKRHRTDDFGDLIRPEDYLRAEERDEINARDTRDTGGEGANRLGEKRKWGDGEQFRKNDRFKRQKQNQFDAWAREGQGQEDEPPTEDSESEVEESPSGPSKLAFASETVQVNLRIAHVDFAGMHDQRSLSMLIPLIRPRKLILIAGTISETAFLAEDCEEKLGLTTNTEGALTSEVLCPDVGETVSASMDANAWSVKLSESLLRRLHWQNVRGLGVVTLMARLTTATSKKLEASQETRLKRQKMTKEGSESPGLDSIPVEPDAVDISPLLDVLPASVLTATRSAAQPLHVGDLRLADLRRLLQNTGHSAEFRGEGTLVIDDFVAVRKSTTGQIEVESVGVHHPGYNDLDPFNDVKRSIYDGLAIIAGGE